MKTQFYNLQFLLPVFIIGWAITILLIPVLIKSVTKYNLLAQPNSRSAHNTPTPAMGGLSFLVVLTVCMLIIPYSKEIIALYTACLLLALTGLLDDAKGLGCKSKFFVQIIAAMLLYFGGFQFNNLMGCFGIHELTPMVSLFTTVFIIVAITNAFNLIDGIDGLAGGLGLINTLVFSVLILVNDPTSSLIILTISFAGSIMGFLKFNVQPAKIFMGDTGSLVLGVFMAALFLKSVSYGSGGTIITAAALIALPLFDMSRVFIIRLLNKKSPFKADKSHLHHLLLDQGHSHKSAAIWCIKTSALILFCSVAIFLLVNTNLKEVVDTIVNLK